LCRCSAGQPDEATRAKRCGSSEECASAAFQFHVVYSLKSCPFQIAQRLKADVIPAFEDRDS
jgi:hypothetical protein